MRNIRRLILTSLAAVAFVGMTVATSHADCNNNVTGNQRSSYGQATGGALPSDSGNMQNPASSSDRYLGEPGNYNEQGVPGRPVEQLGTGAGGQIEQTAPYGSSSYQGVQSSTQYSGQGTGGFTGTQSPCYQGSSVGAGTGGVTTYEQRSFQSGQATGGGLECQSMTPCFRSGPLWSSDGSVGAGSGGQLDPSMSIGTAGSAPVEYHQSYQSSQYTGSGAGGTTGYQQNMQQNVNQSPCWTGGYVGSGTGGATGYQQNQQNQQFQQMPQQQYQQPCCPQGTTYQQSYQSGTYQGQGAGGTQTPCYNQTPCCQGNTMGTSGMTGTTDMRSGYSTPQPMHQQQMRSGTSMGAGAGTGGPCTYTYGSGAGGSMGRDFYGTGFHSWVERW